MTDPHVWVTYLVTYLVLGVFALASLRRLRSKTKPDSEHQD